MTIGEALFAARNLKLPAETSEAEAARLVKQAGLAERKADHPYRLSWGQKRRLNLISAILHHPRLLLLDEPSLGLAPQIVDQIFDLISDLRQRGLTILLVEQNAEMALEIADRGYIYSNGNIELTGSGAELRASDDVASTYLGIKGSE